ncbi:MAG: cobalamin 5'-phosphate synthase [Omnitrophica WOR_2 bacterium GWF2_43_52]|nr:MAG: cobalamin 5'-phosphate synthase [Omnitrophica WOR_2 bacterium GWC2_44_8]OGX22377.1 MAG: cobalamin 5'-phosphate synthase [Omnitrophica WOR_2 bacterium GWF2_43_52]HBG64460.1 adenosylcobinamide-GDP ribazoletransferase [Candidatus Omnitrophota bacterium]HCD37478.1 adenosylcobinamide-GDP ribazoletransferase [Candidatus Omnitrophota bacterium]
MKYFLIALQFLTRIPVIIKEEIEPQGYSRSMAWFPLVGLVLGICLVVVLKIALLLFPRAVAEILVICAYVFLTGALHIDGLADTWDGLCGGKGEKEKTLAIMKDSSVGAMGSLAISLGLLLKFVLLDSIPLTQLPQALIAMAVLGRWAQVLFVYNAASSKPQSSAGYFNSLSPAILIFATGMMVSLCVFILRPFTLISILALLSLTILFFRNYFKRKIGGITGDTIGAVNEITEIFVLLFILL